MDDPKEVWERIKAGERQEYEVFYRAHAGIFSQQPIAGGDPPRRAWIRHDASYLPSAHGGDDATTSLGAIGGIRNAK